MDIRKYNKFQVALSFLLLIFIQACVSPVATYREVLQDANKAVANNTTALVGYYSTTNELSIRSYLDSRMIDFEPARYKEIMTHLIIKPDHIRKRAELISGLSLFSNMMLQVALAKDAAEFKSNAKQAGVVAGKVSKTLKDVAANVTLVTPFVSTILNGIPVEKAFEAAGEQIGNIGAYCKEEKAKEKLNRAFSQENMDKINAVLIFLEDDMIACANRLEDIITSDSAHELATFKLYGKYFKSKYGKKPNFGDKTYAEAIEGFVSQRDKTVNAFMKMLVVKAEPATEGLSALINLNNGLVVYAKSGQTTADKDALRALAKTALESSNMVLESLKIYEETQTSEKTNKQ